MSFVYSLSKEAFDLVQDLNAIVTLGFEEIYNILNDALNDFGQTKYNPADVAHYVYFLSRYSDIRYVSKFLYILSREITFMELRGYDSQIYLSEWTHIFND